MKNFLLTVISLVLVVLVLEFFVPEKYSDRAIYRSDIYKARFSHRVDWVNENFRDRRFDDGGIVKGSGDCSAVAVRVLVIGDSFIYGKGAPPNSTWDAQLAHMVRTSGTDVCVISVGRNGWTTMDEFSFLEQNWDLLHPDYVIFGYVTNDPDFHDVKKKYWFKYKPKICRHVYKMKLANLVTEKFCFILQTRHPTIGYPQWESKIHEAGNLARYREVLIRIRDFFEQKKVPFHFLLTRKSWEHGGEEFHSRIGRLLTDIGISYTDTLPMIRRFFEPFPQAFTWTHPGDAHPSALVSSLFAWHAYEHLCERGVVTYKCDQFHHKVVKVED